MCSELVVLNWTRPSPQATRSDERGCLDLSAKLSFAGWTLTDLAAASLHDHGGSMHLHVLGVLGGSTWRLERCWAAGQEKPVVVSPWAGCSALSPAFLRDGWVFVCEVPCAFLSRVPQQQRFTAFEKHLPCTSNRIAFLKKNFRLFTKDLTAIALHLVSAFCW